MKLENGEASDERTATMVKPSRKSPTSSTLKVHSSPERGSTKACWHEKKEEGERVRMHFSNIFYIPMMVCACAGTNGRMNVSMCV